MAAQLSRQLTGQYFEGVWHTSVVCYGCECFFGQGVSITKPGQSHHGSPLKTISMGATAIDKETYMEYIQGLRQLYTAEKYHLLEFNCNTFSNDVVGFLTGNSIPQAIIDLPAQFLATPFGQSLRPMFEDMYRRPGQGPDAPEAVQAALPALSTLNSGLSMCTNLPSFHQLLSANDCLVAMFTMANCAPCSSIKPIFEELALHHSAPDMPVHQLVQKQAKKIASEYNIRSAPTFVFFSHGHEIHRFSGANRTELMSQTNLLLLHCYPPHSHKKLSLPATQQLLTAIVTFDAPVNTQAAFDRLQQSVAQLPPHVAANLLETFETTVIPFCQKKPLPNHISSEDIDKWNSANLVLLQTLPAADLFPMIDLLRLASTKLAMARSLAPSIEKLLDDHKVGVSCDRPKNTFLLQLRTFTNARLLFYPSHRVQLTSASIDGLLNENSSVRSGAASLAFSLVQLAASSRVDWQTTPSSNEEAWDAEIVSAVLECLRRETDAAVVHRLIATVNLALYNSSSLETLIPLCDALEAETILKAHSGQLGQTAEALRKECITLLAN